MAEMMPSGPGYRRVLVVELLGGIGDLVMVLPAVHALARSHPGAEVTVLTYRPGADLLVTDPAVQHLRTPRHGRSGAAREAVAEALAAVPPDLAVTTTRYDAIPALLEASGARCVTDLWRCPPPDEPIGRRYLRILRDEGLVDAATPGSRPRVHLTSAELAEGEQVLQAHLPAGGARPVLLVTDAGMAVKRWPDRHWEDLVAALAGRGHPLLALAPVPYAGHLPATDLRGLAAVLAAVGRRGGVVVGGDTGPVRLASAVGAAVVVLFGPTLAGRYGVEATDATNLQGLPDCPHRRPASVTEQVCWWHAHCPIAAEPACLAALAPDAVVAAVDVVGEGEG